jgi:acyl dehydratase
MDKAEPTQPAEGKLYLEDLHVGQRFTSATYLMDATRIKEFAAEFDPQPFHLDEGAAQVSVFKVLAASGWNTAAVAMRLMVTGGLPIAHGLIGFGGEFSWPKPTRPGDLLQVESENYEIKPSLKTTPKASLRCEASGQPEGEPFIC